MSFRQLCNHLSTPAITCSTDGRHSLILQSSNNWFCLFKCLQRIMCLYPHSRIVRIVRLVWIPVNEIWHHNEVTRQSNSVGYLPQVRRLEPEGVANEEDGGLGVGGASDVCLLPAEVNEDSAASAGGVQRRRVLPALRARHRTKISLVWEWCMLGLIDPAVFGRPLCHGSILLAKIRDRVYFTRNTRHVPFS